MAFLVPAIAAIASGGGFAATFGALAAGTASFATFAGVASSVLGGLGVLTGNKTLSKAAGLLALGAGVSALASGTSGAASAAGSSGVADAALPAVDDWSAGFSGVTDMAAAPASQLPAVDDWSGGFGGNAGNAGGSILKQVGGWQAEGDTPLSIMQQAQSTQPAPVGGEVQPSRLQTAARTLTPADVTKQVAKDATQKSILSGISDFMRNNKELVQMGGQALASAYGPDAERTDYQKSLMERAYRNQNSPVRFRFGGT